MSTTQQIIDYLKNQPQDRLHGMTFEQVAENTGINREKVNRTLYNLDFNGRIALLRDGRRVLGIDRIVRPERKTPSGPRKAVMAGATDPSNVPARFVTHVPTPNLDAYNKARQRWEEMRSDPIIGAHMGDFPAVNDLAEEANKLRAALIHRDEKYAELSQNFALLTQNYEVMKGEYEGWRKRNIQKVTQEVHEQIAEARPD